MKFFYVSLLIILSSSFAYPQSSWKVINSPTDKSLRSAFFLDSLTGWVGGDSTYLFKTTNGGQSWTQQYSNDSFDLKDIYFLDENNGWAVAVPIDFVLDLYTLLLKTTDGGNTWQAGYFGEPNIYFNSVVYTDTSHGWIGGANGNIYYTSNAGERWAKASIDSGLLSNLDIYRMQFVSDSFAIASGGHFDMAGLIWISRDGGYNWHSYIAAIDPIADFHYYDTLNIVGVSKEIEQYGSGTARTTDGGNNWVYTTFDSIGPASTIEYRTPSEAWISLSTNALLLKSVDSGYTWTAFRSPEDSWVNQIVFPDSLTGFGVGDYGRILKYVKDSVSDIRDNTARVSDFQLFQNYPNPFNPETNISFNLTEPAFTEMSIYNSLGELVAVPVRNYLPSGYHNVKFSAAGIPSGIYFCRIIVNNRSAVRKMTLLR